jgi:hypothetical protein
MRAVVNNKSEAAEGGHAATIVGRANRTAAAGAARRDHAAAAAGSRGRAVLSETRMMQIGSQVAAWMAGVVLVVFA